MIGFNGVQKTLVVVIVQLELSFSKIFVRHSSLISNQVSFTLREKVTNSIYGPEDEDKERCENFQPAEICVTGKLDNVSSHCDVDF